MIQITSAKSIDDPLHQDDFRNRVLNWVLKMQKGPTQFRMNKGADSTIFTSCFSLFVFDLFGEVNIWSQKERGKWIDYINSFQDKDSGYFIPGNFVGALNTKPVQQLTCFCLSGLSILGASPKYRLSFLKEWSGLGAIYDYLRNIGCFVGKPVTGNMAMFLAIFLTYEYQKYNDKSALAKLDSWFHWHEKTQNKSTGFWGNSLKNKYYAGFQNAFHQYVVYNYWNRTIPCYRKIVDIVLSLQDKDGCFAPIPGGRGCWDYDAADILISCGYRRGYRKKDTGSALTKLFFSILKDQNEDGGFCESRKRPSHPIKVFACPSFVFSRHNPYLWYYKLRSKLIASRSKSILNHWTKKGRQWDQSDLWNTWFRCLTLAEIAESIKFDNSLKQLNWKFHDLIGLGYFHKS